MGDRDILQTDERRIMEDLELAAEYLLGGLPGETSVRVVSPDQECDILRGVRRGKRGAASREEGVTCLVCFIFLMSRVTCASPYTGHLHDVRPDD